MRVGFISFLHLVDSKAVPPLRLYCSLCVMLAWKTFLMTKNIIVKSLSQWIANYGLHGKHTDTIHTTLMTLPQKFQLSYFD